MIREYWRVGVPAYMNLSIAERRLKRAEFAVRLKAVGLSEEENFTDEKLARAYAKRVLDDHGIALSVYQWSPL